MGSDRARISYDERQQYRSVVMQQGRVTLEADWNESQVISAEGSRKDLLDIVGPAGTPDNGYAVTFPVPGFDFHPLKGKPQRYSIHVNGPWCLTFEFEGGDCLRTDFEQYH